MASNIKITFVVIVLGAIVAVVMYFYMSSHSNILLKEAEDLYSAGDLYGAHDKAAEALKADTRNRKAIDVKSRLYSEVKNDTNYKQAQEEYQLGLVAMNRNKYKEAGEHFYSAFRHADNVSTRASQYGDAQKLYKEVLAKYNELDDRVTEYHYKNALRIYVSGDPAGAFESLQQAPKETQQVANLRSNIAYDLGLKRYEEIMVNPDISPLSYYNDAIYWFKLIDSASSHYKEAQDAIKILTEQQPRN